MREKGRKTQTFFEASNMLASHRRTQNPKGSRFIFAKKALPGREESPKPCPTLLSTLYPAQPLQSGKVSPGTSRRQAAEIFFLYMRVINRLL